MAKSWPKRKETFVSNTPSNRLSLLFQWTRMCLIDQAQFAELVETHSFLQSEEDEAGEELALAQESRCPDFLTIKKTVGSESLPIYSAYVTDLNLPIRSVASSQELLQMACDEFYRRTRVVAQSRDKWCNGETEIYSHNEGSRGCPWPTNFIVDKEV